MMNEAVVNNVVYASFDDLLADTEVEYDVVTVSGKSYRIGSLTAEDFVAWTELRDSGEKGKKDASALLITRSLVDEKGKRIGDETRLSQAKKMKLKTSETFLRKIFKLNGINQPDEKATKND